MVRRSVNQYNFDKLQFDERILSKHFSKQDSKDVRYIVIHHMFVKDRNVNDDDGLDACYNIWQSRPASAHYGVDGKFIGQFVWDKDYAWATGSTEGNRYGISIEHVNKTLDERGTDNDFLVSEETWKNGAKLTAYLHKVYKMGRPVKDKTVRRHGSFSATACPGPYLGKEIWDDYVEEAQRVYDQIIDGKAPTQSPSSTSKPSRSKSSTKPSSSTSAPKFPLPKGSYFGPKSGPASSVSGYYGHRADLKRWQTQMKKRGWALDADGLYNPTTAKVAKQFQKEKKLSVDGLIGADTWAAAWKAPVT